MSNALINSDNLKCPVCGNNTMHDYKFENPNLHYFLAVCNSQTKAVDYETGIALDFYGCSSCGAMILKNPKLISK